MKSFLEPETLCRPPEIGSSAEAVKDKSISSRIVSWPACRAARSGRQHPVVVQEGHVSYAESRRSDCRVAFLPGGADCVESLAARLELAGMAIKMTIRTWLRNRPFRSSAESPVSQRNIRNTQGSLPCAARKEVFVKQFQHDQTFCGISFLRQLIHDQKKACRPVCARQGSAHGHHACPHRYDRSECSPCAA